VSFICVSGLFQTFTEDFSVQFVDSVFLSSRFSLTVHFLNVSLLLVLLLDRAVRVTWISQKVEEAKKVKKQCINTQLHQCDRKVKQCMCKNMM